MNKLTATTLAMLATSISFAANLNYLGCNQGSTVSYAGITRIVTDVQVGGSGNGATWENGWRTEMVRSNRERVFFTAVNDPTMDVNSATPLLVLDPSIPGFTDRGLAVLLAANTSHTHITFHTTGTCLGGAAVVDFVSIHDVPADAPPFNN